MPRMEPSSRAGLTSSWLVRCASRAISFCRRRGDAHDGAADASYRFLTVRQLMWRKFAANRIALASAAFLIFAYIVVIFAGFFAPYSPYSAVGTNSYHPPTPLRFHDPETGEWFRWPFFFGTTRERNENFMLEFSEDRSQRHFLKVFVQQEEPYSVLGLFESRIHLFGSDEARFYLLGADQRGRDMLSRIIHGGRISMSIGLLGVAIMVVLGAILGAVSGYFGGWVDSGIQRLIEVLRTFPQLALWMALAAAIPPEWSSLAVYVGIVVVMGMISWTQLAREVRGQVMSLKANDYVYSAEASGASRWRVMSKHLIPNTMSHIIVTASLYVPVTIIGESALSFLGIGVVAPMISWGVLLRDATKIEALAIYPWVIFPGLAILIVTMAFNFLGDGLRDMADPFA